MRQRRIVHCMKGANMPDEAARLSKETIDQILGRVTSEEEGKQLVDSINAVGIMAGEILDAPPEERSTAFRDAGIWVFSKAIGTGASTDDAIRFARDWMLMVKHMMDGIERTRRDRVKH